jgi:sugar phosphate isomerase/epimerase
MKSAVTISLVPEAVGGPFVYWNDVEVACESASRLGFNAVELFAPGPDAVDIAWLHDTLANLNLELAAVGTGAGMVKHKLSLSDPDAARRRAAIEFAANMIEYGAAFKAPAIIGSMQGRAVAPQTRDQALGLLKDSLTQLSEIAEKHSVRLILEPVNRYETNLIRSVTEGVDFLSAFESKNICLLADLFHLNIEEPSISDAINAAGNLIGHVHLADSNRWAAGFGHTDFAPIVRALQAIQYDGYLSAEVFSLPDAESAAAMTMDTFRKLIASLNDDEDCSE